MTFRAGSIPKNRPRPVTDKAGTGVVSSPERRKVKPTLAESVIHFCKTNRNCSGAQIIFFIASEQARILEEAIADKESR